MNQVILERNVELLVHSIPLSHQLIIWSQETGKGASPGPLKFWTISWTHPLKSTWISRRKWSSKIIKSPTRRTNSSKFILPCFAGSYTLDIPCPKDNFSKPMPLSKKSGEKLSIPSGIVGLIIGRSNQIMKDIAVHTGIIDSNSFGEILIIVSVTTIWTFKKGEHIGHLLLLHYIMHNKTDRQRLGGFGSSDQGNLNKPPMAFISIKKNMSAQC